MEQAIINDLQSIISRSREAAIRSVDHARVLMYWHIGKRIFEEEQDGHERAVYGERLIPYISEQLLPEFGSAFSVRNLNYFRQFYRAFPIVNALRSQLSWTHYRSLMSIDNAAKKAFYVAEAVRNNWSARQLDRQIETRQFERSLETKINDIPDHSTSEAHPQEPKDIVKDPMFLEFLGFKRDSSYYEKDIEAALITHLQEFMLELGNGYSFVARQKRIHLDGDDFFVDLVFYNRLLQCFVIIELKTNKITHQDLGQLQMYVNYYDRIEKLAHESPTVGILLCLEKNDTVVRFSLPEKSNIFASKYQLYLPSEKQLSQEIKNEIKRQQQKLDDKGNVDNARR